MPAYRSLSFNDTARCVCPGQEQNPAPLYRIPYGSIFSYAITTPIIGMAFGAYEAHVAYMRERVRAAYAGCEAAEDPFSQVRVAEAASDLDAAWLALEAQHARADGATSPPARRSRCGCGCGSAATRCAAPSRRSTRSTGSSRTPAAGRSPRHPIQRFWRDAHAGRVHAINDPERALSMFGRGEFGLSVADAMV